MCYLVPPPLENTPFQKRTPKTVQIRMRVYADTNIYVAYLLGEKGEAEADRFFRRGIGCKFILVASNTIFSEIALACGGRALPLLQKHIDDFKDAGKLEVVEENEGQTEEARELNEKTGNRYGLNDFSHAILAKKHADLFVTNDFRFLGTASKIVKTKKLGNFLSEL